jgi:selenocysteine-specific elongation factor
MRRLILGTAGHIDHGKTALVKHLTGVDTDRLKEEKERGITVDLGFAELVTPDGTHFGVVDVPGHEGFIRNMVAGATGMDLVLMVVAADEGVMPQTREHLAIVTLLAVPRIVVALTKSDLVDEEWIELVTEDVQELLRSTPYPEAPILPVSVVSGDGMAELQETLVTLASQGTQKAEEDLARLPIDRVFTIKGAGTVVTGTLWSGTLRVDDRVQLLPGTLTGRVRSLQLHGQEVKSAPAGSRVAVGLTGSGIHHQTLFRGQTLVVGPGWEPSSMLTCRLTILPDTGWEVEQGQRVRVHLGTAEVLARVAVLQGDRIAGGEEGWVQLRLEEPMLARGGDHLVVRAYSPVTTIGGGRVVEVLPPKQRRLTVEEADALASRLDAPPSTALDSLLATVGWAGIHRARLPHRLGLSPQGALDAAERVCGEGTGVRVEEHYFSQSSWEEGRELALATLSTFHSQEPLRPGMALQELRQILPKNAGPGLGEALITGLAKDELLVLDKGIVRLPDFSPTLSKSQERSREELRRLLGEAGLSPPSLSELAQGLEVDQDQLKKILRLMEVEGEVLGMEGGFFFLKSAVLEAGIAVVSALGGRSGLGPADFREVLGVTRKYLLPLLRFMDTAGVTTRLEEDRRVSEELPDGWGTPEGPGLY